MNLARLLLTICLGLGICLGSVQASHEVVLVASSNSPVDELSSLQLRKIFLGYNVKHDGENIKGLRNTTDSSLNKIFLQTVVAMSEKAYDRRQLSQALRQGIPRVSEFGDMEKLVSALSEDPFAVSYMGKEEADRMPGIRIIRVLWDR